jgi:hypothetical protein
LLAGGNTLGYCKSVTSEVLTDNPEPQIQRTQGLYEQLQSVLSGTKLKMIAGEVLELKELITGFQDIFTPE